MSQIFEFARFTATEFQLLRRVLQWLLRFAVRVMLKVGTLKRTHTDSDFSNFRLRPVSTQNFIFLTVHLGTIRVNNQLDALFVYLFHFSTCFEQPSAHHQENQLYQYII